MDLSTLAGGDLGSIATDLTTDGTWDVRIGIDRGGIRQALIVLCDVTHFRFDGPVDFIDEIVVHRLPPTGVWPAQARHLLAHHDNTSEKVWVRLSGPMVIEVLASRITVQ